MQGRSTVVTMDDIAKRAGVSRATVSYVLNKRKRTSGSISEETCQRVFKAAADLKYRTNELAKAMVSGRSNVLGLLTSPFNSGNNFELLTGVIKEAADRDYLVKVMHIGNDGDDVGVLERCQQWMIAGLILFGLADDAQRTIYKSVAEFKMPLVLIDDKEPLTMSSTVVRSDDAFGINLAVDHLVHLGHKRIGYLGATPCVLNSDREKYFRDAMTRLGLSINPKWVTDSNWGYAPVISEKAYALLSDKSDRPTALVCPSDVVAMVTIRVARSLGISVPTDLSIIGYSNSFASPYVDPPLTSIDQGFTDMGSLATSKLIAQIEDPTNRNEHLYEDILSPTRLIVRESTAIAR